MTPRTRGAFIALTLTMTIGLALAQPGPTQAATPDAGLTDPAWVTSDSTSLIGVTAVSTNDVWAVGWREQDNHRFTLTEHWDGTQWSVVASPNRSPWRDNVLSSVTAVSSDDVWAVGFFGSRTPGETYRALTMHWDGVTWTIVPGANGHNYTALVDVSAISSTDVWAVGGITKNYGKWYRGVLEHWDGISWSIVDSTLPRRRVGGFYAVDAVSNNDVWATSGSDGFYHYDGLWTPYDGADADGAFGLSMLNSDDGWVVERDHAHHWDGAGWDDTFIPGVYLYGVSAFSSNDVWAVGNNAAHWDGTRWTKTQIGGGTFWDVDMVSKKDVWAVGFILNEQAVSAHWDGSRWTEVPLG